MFPSASPGGRVSGKQDSMFSLGSVIKCILFNGLISEGIIFCALHRVVEHLRKFFTLIHFIHFVNFVIFV